MLAKVVCWFCGCFRDSFLLTLEGAIRTVAQLARCPRGGFFL